MVRRYCSTVSIGIHVSYKSIDCDRIKGPTAIPSLQEGEKFMVELDPQSSHQDRGLYICASMQDVAEVLVGLNTGVYTHVYSWGILTEID